MLDFVIGPKREDEKRKLDDQPQSENNQRNPEDRQDIKANPEANSSGSPRAEAKDL